MFFAVGWRIRISSHCRGTFRFSARIIFLHIHVGVHSLLVGLSFNHLFIRIACQSFYTVRGWTGLMNLGLIWDWTWMMNLGLTASLLRFCRFLQQLCGVRFGAPCYRRCYQQILWTISCSYKKLPNCRGRKQGPTFGQFAKKYKSI